ncbi:MAG: DUF4332 domain-containing protein [Chloroflexi bacterium]|nr:DUF4332 domain-containing protein [Chloroflexota bacterium]
MALKISELKGITSELEAKLKEQGIKDSDQYLEATRLPAGRQTLAKSTGASAKDLLELANRADLARVKGIGGVYGDLLEVVGVDTVKELANRRPENLHEKIVTVNAEKKIVTRPPTLQNVQDWVAQAKELPKLLEY